MDDLLLSLGMLVVIAAAFGAAWRLVK